MEQKFISVMNRYELKFLLNKEQVEYFLNEINKYMKVDKYGLTTILSLYYDTPNFSLINKSLEKPEFKEKLRLRSYGLSKDGSQVYLEVKRKNNKFVYKRRIGSTEEGIVNFLSNNVPIDDSQICKELDAFKSKYGLLEPKYLLIYDRVAFYKESTNIRVTVDKNLRYRKDNLNLHYSSDGIHLLDEGSAILEIKVQYSMPLWLTQILTKGKIFETSYSKVGTVHQIETRKVINQCRS